MARVAVPASHPFSSRPSGSGGSVRPLRRQRFWRLFHLWMAGSLGGPASTATKLSSDIPPARVCLAPGPMAANAFAQPGRFTSSQPVPDRPSLFDVLSGPSQRPPWSPRVRGGSPRRGQSLPGFWPLTSIAGCLRTTISIISASSSSLRMNALRDGRGFWSGWPCGRVSTPAQCSRKLRAAGTAAHAVRRMSARRSADATPGRRA